MDQAPLTLSNRDAESRVQELSYSSSTSATQQQIDSPGTNFFKFPNI